MQENPRQEHAKPPQEIIVSMDEKSVRSLVQSKASLMVFKAVSNSDAAARPLLWARTSKISLKMNVRIDAETAFFTSTQSRMKEGQLVTATVDKKGDPGDVFEIRPNTGGDGVVKQSGAPNLFSFQNPTPIPLLCGLTQSINGRRAPYCGVTLHGKSAESFALSSKVLLAFSSGSKEPGTVYSNLNLTQKSKPFNAIVTDLVVIDLGNAAVRKVSFDINRGWNWRSNVWGKGYSSEANLAKLLIL